MVATGLNKAIEVTIQIALNLPNKSNHELYKKSVHSIFDDQLRTYTTMNRIQRHNARKELKKALKRYGIL